MSLTIEVCKDQLVWDQFIDRSPQGSIFCKKDFLAALNEEFALYFILDAGEPVLAVPVEVETGGPPFVPYEHYTTFRFAIYQGPMFSPEVEAMPTHRGVPYRLKVMDFLLEELTQMYKRLCFPLHHKLQDVRSFLWFNYHNEAGGRFATNVRYTGLIDLQESTQESFLQQARRDRRHDYAHAEELGISIAESDDPDILDSLEDSTFARQSLAREEDERRYRRSIVLSSLANKYGKYLVAKTADGEVASAFLYLFDDRCAYHLFAGNNPDKRKTGASTYLAFNAVKFFREEGKRWFDTIGMNSPNRGEFKTSLNARPTVHFLVSWAKP